MGKDAMMNMAKKQCGSCGNSGKCKRSKVFKKDKAIAREVLCSMANCTKFSRKDFVKEGF